MEGSCLDKNPTKLLHGKVWDEMNDFGLKELLREYAAQLLMNLLTLLHNLQVL